MKGSLLHEASNATIAVNNKIRFIVLVYKYKIVEAGIAI